MKTYAKIISVSIILCVGLTIGYFLTYGSADINKDGKVNELDFSIMMIQWTK